jgi:SAM-dependent methyltransferase
MFASDGFASADLFRDSMQTKKEEWDVVWKEQGFFARIVNFARGQYNGVFRKLLRQHIDQESSVAELGCGSLSLLLSMHSEVKHITGVDFSSESLRLSTKNARAAHAKNVTLVEDDCRDLKHVTRPVFDLVWSQGLLEHFSDPAQVLSQHLRICKKDGVVLISVPARYSYHFIWYSIAKIPFLKWVGFWGVEQDFFTKGKLRKVVEDAGYDPKKGVRVFYLQPFVLGLLILELRKGELVEKKQRSRAKR